MPFAVASLAVKQTKKKNPVLNKTVDFTQKDLVIVPCDIWHDDSGTKPAEKRGNKENKNGD